MIIKAYNKEYDIVQRLSETETQEVFICEKHPNADNKQYLVIHMKNQQLAHHVIPLFIELMEKKSFSDYDGCFSSKGDFYLAFLYEPAPLLADKLLTERCSLRERLEIAKRLLEKIVLLEPPPWLLGDLLSHFYIMVSQSDSISFFYVLKNYEQYESFAMEKIPGLLIPIFLKLFPEELKLASCPALTEFYQSLSETGIYNNYFSIFRAYKEIYDELISQQKMENIKPNHWSFHWWDKIKQLKRLVKPVAACLVLAAIIFFMVWMVLNRKKPEGPEFSYIGTVEIQSGLSEQQEKMEPVR